MEYPALMQPGTLGILAAAFQGMNAAGPSRMPVSMGQVIGQGGLAGIGTMMQAASEQRKAEFQQMQMQQVQQSLAMAQQKQAQLMNFAQSLPEQDRAAFMAAPDEFLKARFAAHSIRPGGKLVSGTGATIAEAPAAPTLVDVPVPNQPGVTQPTWLRPGETNGATVGGTKSPDILNPEVQRARIAVAAAGKPSISMNVNNKLGEGLAGEVKNIVANTQSAAAGAVDTLDTVKRIQTSIDKGNVNVGPGATIRTKIGQIAQIIGINGENDAEKLVNTRNVMRGLAQFTVAARKSLKGQGQVSDYEGKLLARAESGEIDDFTIPELKDFLKTTDRLARKAHAEHKRIIGVIGNSSDEAVRGLVPYFDVPDLPADPAAPAAPPITTEGRKLYDKYLRKK